MPVFQSPGPAITPQQDFMIELAALVSNAPDGLTVPDLVLAQRRFREAFGERFHQEAFYASLGVDAEENEVPRIWESTEFLEYIGDPPPMLIDQLIPENSLILGTGKSKHGKSYAFMDLAFSVQQGWPVWENFVVNRPGPVLYIQMEDSQFETANRFLKRGLRKSSAPNSKATRFHLLTDRLILSSAEGIARMEQAITQYMTERPVLVIVDTAREGLGIKDWLSTSEIADKCRALREWSRKNCSVLLISHNRKQQGGDEGDEIAGNGAFASSSDGWISCQRAENQPNGNRRMWWNVNGRGNMNAKIVTEMDTENLHLRTVPDDEIERGFRDEKQAKREKKFGPIAAFFRARKEPTATVAEIASGVGEEEYTARRMVAEMVQAGQLVDTGQKRKSGQGKPSPLYALPGYKPPKEDETDARFSRIDTDAPAEPEPPRETGPVGPPAIDADVSDLSDPFGGEPVPTPAEVEAFGFHTPLDPDGPEEETPAYTGEASGVVWHFAPRSYDPKKGTWTASAGGFHGASGRSQREAIEGLREEAAGGEKTYFPFGEEEGVALDVAAALTACALELGRLDVEGEPVDAAAWVKERGRV